MKKYQAYIKVDLTVAPEVMAFTKAEAEEKLHNLPMEKLLAEAYRLEHLEEKKKSCSKSLQSEMYTKLVRSAVIPSL